MAKAKVRRQSHPITIYNEHSESLPPRCKVCKKAPRNCVCETYRLVLTPAGKLAHIFVDNVATAPTRGEQVGMWKMRRNSRTWRNVIYVDGLGPILTIRGTDDEWEETIKLIEQEIEDGIFDPCEWVDVEGVKVNVLNYDRDMVKRHKFLRQIVRACESSDDEDE